MSNNTKQEKAIHSLKQSVKKMLPAVFTALVATALGFLALYTSPVPMVQDFGKMLTVGMIVSFLLSVFLLIPILFTRDYFFPTKQVRKKHKQKTKKLSIIERVFEIWTKKLLALRWIIIVLAFMTAAFGIWVDLDAGVETDVETFMPQDTQELKDIHSLRDIMGATDQVSIVYQGDYVITDEEIIWVDNMTSSIKTEFPNVVVSTRSITSVVKQMNNGQLVQGEEFKDELADISKDQLKLFLNDDWTKGVITVEIKHLETGQLQTFISELERYLEKNETAGVEQIITGKSVLDVAMIEGLTTGRYQMTLLGMGLVFLGLLMVYRQPVKAFIPLLPIILIVGWSGLAMYLLNIDYTPLTSTLGALIIGIGTEFTVLIMERYYEERESGKNSKTAIGIANKKIGKGIIASAFTTIGGFSSLLASDFVILNNFGLMTLINISLALISTIFVMPSILIVLDRFVKIKYIRMNEG
ncbi:hypothetical protein SAMN05216232_3841 [Virgibacillus subterraneus]|uniref:Membrane transport protein MMPL domain-containing protein n=2 Tax=Virgibacillus TaxID=84406 RepID=A0A1H1F3Q2_9BACI|nr:MULTISPECIES: MMPL family transporter [Virgibacillus]SDQ95613.1 hypothetical protein SAMN05216231_3194 [Virgibacillus salinus]SEQ96850.1 hypothetical protein SAMN05216232_3841 [Virgibacillus subterraneus]